MKNFKTLMATFASTLLFLVQSNAEDFTYTNTNGTITITGYTGSGGDVTIPSTIAGVPVSSIGDFAFWQTASLTNLTIPDSVTSIGDGAFDGCQNLASVTIGNGVASIGYAAFNFCTSLTWVSIPDSVTNIKDGFNSIGGGGAFSYCANLTNVLVGTGVTNIGDWAFYLCSSLTSMYCRGNAARPGTGVFANAGNVTVYHPPGTTGWGPTFGGRPTALWNQPQDFTYASSNGTITITGYTGPGGAVTIPSVIAGLPVSRIGGLAFNNQSSVTSLAIPDSITSFESGLAPAGGAFGFCTGLTNLVIPHSVTNIGDYAFVFCTHMVGVYFKGNSPSLGAQVFQNNNATVFYLPGTAGWGPTFGGRPTALWDQAQDFTSTNTNGTITITGYTGPGGAVTIPTTINGPPVTSVGDRAFSGLNNLTGVTIPDSVTNLGDQAFFGCSSLASLTIGNGITSIRGGVDNGYAGTFGNCTSLTRVTIPDSVTNIGDGPLSKGGPLGAFYYCTSLTNVTIGKGLTYLGLGAFSYCSNLVGVYFRGNAPTPGQNVLVGIDIFQNAPATAYYLPQTTGWEAGYAGIPAALWNPTVQTNNASFGVRQNRFGFNIAGTPDIPLVVETSTNIAGGLWVPLQSCTLTNGSIYFSDAEWTNYASRLYRIRAP